jgi:hypothetical protein
MKHSPRLITSKHLLLSAITGCALLASGCASLSQETCAQFEERTKEVDYATHYWNSEADLETSARHFKSLPKNTSAVARLYKLQLDATTTNPCRHVVIRKELYLLRATKQGMEFDEIREFYAGDGTLIATKRETVSKQLSTSGYYVATVPLPIPRMAPMGKYLVVSKLIVRTAENQQGTLLAKTSAGFQVIPRDGCAPPT